MKVLVISHNPITTYQSMGKTFLSLFSEFKKDELCQFYIYPSLPDVDACNSYYRITDRNIFDSYTHFGKVNGRELSSKDIDTSKHNFYENEKEESFINVKKTAVKTLFRDLMWKFSRWFTQSLKHWIEEERPTCIFFAPGEAKFIYDVVLKISKEFNLPIITYICDEFYFIDKVEGVIDKYRLHLLQKKIRQLMSKTCCIIAISDEINKQYFNEFNVHTETIMTGASIPIDCERETSAVFKGITYLGNLAYDRVSSLIEIGKALDEINNSGGTNLKVFLYTRSLSEEIKNRISGIKSIEYCGYVTGDDFVRTLTRADALLHIESFKDIYVEKVKNSISTKIADSLASGNPLVAYAPEQIASMRYLAAENAALTITSPDELVEKLSDFAMNQKVRARIAENGIKAARRHHIALANSVRLRNICGEYSS